MNGFAFRHFLLQRARELRKNQTQAEAILWERLRDRRLGGFKFRRQHVMHDRIVDFYSHDPQLIIEIDGESHRDLEEKDDFKDYEILFKGYKTIRFTNNEVVSGTDQVCAQILKICCERNGQAHRNSNRYADNY